MAEKIVELSGLKITGYDEDYILQTIEKTGQFYEQALLDEWTPLLGSPKVILDIGANLGNHTLYWATKLDVKKIFSFEPFPANYACLRKNVKNNGLDVVEAVQFAVGDKCSKAHVNSFDPDNYGATSFEYAETSEQDDDIRVVTIDSVRDMLGIQNVDFVKIDTEGFELRVLNGMKHILEQDRPVLWIEVGDQTVADILSFLDQYNYQLAKMSGANLLFMPERLKQSTQVTLSEALTAEMLYLSRTNAYYKNYETAKKWLAAKQEQVDKHQETIEKLKQQCLQIPEMEKKLEESNDKIAEQERLLNENNEKLAAQEQLLKQSYSELGTQEQLLESVKRQMQQMNAKLQLLHIKNKEYETKLNKIYGTWYGRMALKVYKVLRKVKRIFRK